MYVCMYESLYIPGSARRKEPSPGMGHGKGAGTQEGTVGKKGTCEIIANTCCNKPERMVAFKR